MCYVLKVHYTKQVGGTTSVVIRLSLHEEASKNYTLLITQFSHPIVYIISTNTHFHCMFDITSNLRTATKFEINI